jgi:hypothetical protein
MGQAHQPLSVAGARGGAIERTTFLCTVLAALAGRGLLPVPAKFCAAARRERLSYPG